MGGMLTRLKWLKRTIGWLGLGLFLSAPFEQMMPDDCDGHVAITSAVAGQPGPGHAPSSSHLPTAPHTCHDLHNHGGFAVAVALGLVPPATVVAPERVAARIHPTTAAHESFRPPIA